jgi:geranylgeranyl reductase family protein
VSDGAFAPSSVVSGTHPARHPVSGAFDVLVVGLGPAGATAAAEAACRGARVLAVDRRRVAGEPVQCAEFVPAILGSEVPTLAQSVCQPIATMRTFVEDEPPDVTPDFPGCMLDRARFDAALVDRARAAGATCVLGHAVRDLEVVGASARAHLADGRVITARVIIGADGPRSLVGRALGSVNTELLETRQVTVPLRQPQRSTDVFLSAAIVGGYAWLFPKGSCANVGAGVRQERRRELAGIVASLQQRLAREGTIGSTVSRITGGAIPVGGMLASSGRLGETLVLLAGDAAGLTNPITGAGIAAAVMSGRLAGRAAAAHADGDDHAAADYRDELEAIFGASLARGLRHRRALDERWPHGQPPTPGALRRAWIAYPEYWAAPAATETEVPA